MATVSEPLGAGARYYGALTLPLYDMIVLRLVVQHAWRCPLTVERALYDRCVGARHLDVGVASGYFLDRARWPVAQPKLTLMDLNPNSTRYAAHRMRRFLVDQVVGDALERFPVDGVFDSIGLFHLLHCIPGTIPEKSRVLDNAAAVLAPGGVVFGANVTPVDGAVNAFARAVLKASHRIGALNNAADSHADMMAALEKRFEDVRVELRGCMTLWEARTPRIHGQQ